MKIYVLGNPLVVEDSVPLKILPQLKQIFPEINFCIVDPTENFPVKDEKDLIILDTVINIRKPLILDLSDVNDGFNTPVSPHDYDLLMHLLLLKKLKKVSNVKIIGVPKKVNINLIKDIKIIIASLRGIQ